MSEYDAAAVIGRNLSECRARHDPPLSLDAIAREARSYGLRWNTARVSRIERGDGAVTVETLLMLSLVLSTLTQRSVAPAELLRSEHPISIAPEATLRTDVARQVLDGELAGLFVDDLEESPVIEAADVGPQVARHLSEEARTVLLPLAGSLGGIDVKYGLQLREGWARWALSDDRNAAKLGLADDVFLAWCIRLWGRSMSQETEARAPVGATPQKKGRITRELLAELQEAMSRGDD